MKKSTLKKVVGAGAVAATIALGSVGTLASAQVGATTTTPGSPNTGAGGDAATTLFTLAAAALIAGAGMTYLYRERTFGR